MDRLKEAVSEMLNTNGQPLAPQERADILESARRRLADHRDCDPANCASCDQNEADSCLTYAEICLGSRP